MRDHLTRTRDGLISFLGRLRGPTLVPALCVGAAVAGCLLLSILVTIPAYTSMKDARSTLLVRRQDAQTAWQARQAEPERLEKELAQRSQDIGQTTGLLLSAEESSRLLDLLYREASESAINVADLRVQPGAQTPEDTYYTIRAFRLRATGDSQGLMRFVARLKALIPSAALQLQNVQIVKEGQAHALTMDIALYSETGGDTKGALASAPTANPTTEPSASATVAAASISETPTPSPYLVRPTDWPDDWPWPPQVDCVVHTVQPGDTLYSLALKYQTTVDVLKQINGLQDDTILANQQILVPLT